MKLQHENTLLDVEEKKENDSEPLEEEKSLGL